MSTELTNFQKGRGAQKNADNPYLKNSYVTEHIEGIDEPFIDGTVKTEFFTEHSKKIINKVNSPDIGSGFSMNPYQGCEHGCIYCYARNSHQYWGFSAGIDFESKIVVKKNAALLLAKAFDHHSWKSHPIMFSGNTDCYQPAERKYKLTRQMLEVCLKYKNPVSMITKNSLILRDLDLLKEMAALNLVHVSVSMNSLREEIRLKLEPRTASMPQRLKTMEELSKNGIPVNIMVAPIIPGLTDHEIPEVIKAAADRGVLSAHFTIVRLNGSIAEIFTDWVQKAFPERAEKILHQIAECHGGKLNDSRYGTRMSGEGKTAEAITDLFRLSRKRYMEGREMPDYDLTLFKRPGNGQMSLF
ncbi:MAG TPA: PA0069 family radical SAM protein [Cytophagaceae bacterium]|jgi:DNA repair photolyase|nr:PA0069 family radical SAM protein [Cytophagaceae bacterium]